MALAIGRKWGVGAKADIGDPRRNAGLVLLLVPRRNGEPGTRAVRIEVGQGLEGIVTDAAAGRSCASSCGPTWRAGATDAGCWLSARALVQSDRSRLWRHRLRPDGVPATAGTVRRTHSASAIILPILFFIFFILIASGALGGRRRRRRGVYWGGPWIGGGWGGGGGFGGGGGGGFGGFGGGGGFSGGGAGGRF